MFQNFKNIWRIRRWWGFWKPLIWAVRAWWGFRNFKISNIIEDFDDDEASENHWLEQPELDEDWDISKFSKLFEAFDDDEASEKHWFEQSELDEHWDISKISKMFEEFWQVHVLCDTKLNEYQAK